MIAKQFVFDEKHPAYFVKNYIIPLNEEGKLKYIIPEKPRRKNQQIIVAELQNWQLCLTLRISCNIMEGTKWNSLLKIIWILMNTNI